MGISTSPSCPAYWPELIWSIHQPVTGAGPDLDPRVEELDSFFAAIAIRELTTVLRDPTGSSSLEQMAALRDQLVPFIKDLMP